MSDQLDNNEVEPEDEEEAGVTRGQEIGGKHRRHRTPEKGMPNELTRRGTVVERNRHRPPETFSPGRRS